MNDGPKRMKLHKPPRLRVADAAVRGSRQQRGYDRQWEKVQALKVKDDPLCGRCLDKGKLTPTQMVHHKIPVDIRPDLRLDPGNLESLCWSCHAAIDHDKLRQKAKQVISKQSRDMQGPLYS